MIAYSSLGHAAICLMGVFSNIIVVIEGAIVLGLAPPPPSEDRRE